MSNPNDGPVRRDEILTAAADLFRDKGYHATSMSNIADAMHMRKASLYHHITSKEAVLYEISVSSMEHILAALGSVRSTNIEARLKEVIVKHLEALLGDRSWHATALVELRSLSPEQRSHVVNLRSRYESFVDEALANVQRKSGRWPGMEIPVVRMALLGMLNWTVFWFTPGGPETAESLAEKFYDIFIPPLRR